MKKIVLLLSLAIIFASCAKESDIEAPDSFAGETTTYDLFVTYSSDMATFNLPIDADVSTENSDIKVYQKGEFEMHELPYVLMCDSTPVNLDYAFRDDWGHIMLTTHHDENFDNPWMQPTSVHYHVVITEKN